MSGSKYVFEMEHTVMFQEIYQRRIILIDRNVDHHMCFIPDTSQTFFPQGK